jgi:mannitol/fructose-specific phosphotransferase system IIA component (Ntr-type)
MGIKEVIIPSLLIKNLVVDSKKEALKQIVNILYEKSYIKDSQSVLTSLLKREDEMSTEIAEGLHLPHAKCEDVEGIIVVYANIIVDNQEELYFVILSNNTLVKQYIKVIGIIAKLISSNSFIEKITKCKELVEIQQVFQLA